METTYKYEVSFEWQKSPAGYRLADIEPCDVWGIPFSGWDDEKRNDFQSLVQFIPDGPFLIENDPASQPTPWNPLENPLLFAQFADIERNADSFVDWAGEHGRLIDVERDLENYIFVFPEYAPFLMSGLRQMEKKGVHIIKRDNRFYYRAKADPLEFWFSEHHDLRLAVRLWELIMNKDSQLVAADERHWLSDASMQEFLAATTGDEIAPRVFTTREKFNAIKNASAHLQRTIIQKLAQYPLNVAFRQNAKGRLYKELRPTSLLSAMWYQLYLAQTGEIRLRRCAICGKWENMEGHRSTWSKHANCANYRRVKRAREKNKIGDA